MAKLTTAEFIEAIKELSVLELNELVKAYFEMTEPIGIIEVIGSLFKVNFSTFSFKFSFEVFSFCFRNAFFNDLWSSVNNFFRFFKAKTCNFTNDFDNFKISPASHEDLLCLINDTLKKCPHISKEQLNLLKLSKNYPY